MVNKKWYNEFLRIKYWEVSLPLNLDNIIFNNITNSKFEPGKYIKSMIFRSITPTAHLKDPTLFTGNPFQVLINKCPFLKHIALPASMDSLYSEQSLTYILQALEDTNTWNLHSLSVNTKSGFVSYDVAEIEYFNCQQHFQHSLRCLRLRKGMVTEEDFDWSEDFEWLQEFKNLETLIVGRNIVENLEDCCDMIDNLRQLEKLTVHFAPLSHNDPKTIAIDAEANDDDATSSASIVSATAAATDEIKIQISKSCNYINIIYQQSILIFCISKDSTISRICIFHFKILTPQEIFVKSWWTMHFLHIFIKPFLLT